ncbi:MAG: NAD(P)/FAD-dependent oxidoreductase [Planctomycetaceae bacterium]|nr:NAD(P)/FAD-dependent oxidoreductase [Planctomycetaceae bacterium]MCP4461318.1 NAD(P)/FAD-dependent oxidoreductase [Planctomycetaceae bacterium]MDG1809334.1 NAD(P)/FAD-dependent oxidoreductase [Pirellulaceae bacterium]
MYDTIIIGAGMSGLAAGIRLAHYDQKVCILERHYTIGGLNSFYRVGGRDYDVGLHAVTNFTEKGAKKGPLAKILRQLRFKWEEFSLSPQAGSRISFPGMDLKFDNDIELLRSEIASRFPDQIDGFRKLEALIGGYDQLDQEAFEQSTREIMGTCITDPLLTDMLLCPLMWYGNAREHDMDWGQFSIMFESIYREGFARPFKGVRLILKNLVKRYRSLGGELKLRKGVKRIHVQDGHAQAVELDDGEIIVGKRVLSSAGRIETLRMCDDVSEVDTRQVGKLTFIESISILDRQPTDLGLDETIVFYNDSDKFHWERPQDDLCDMRTGVICSPNNYEYADGQQLDEGVVRITSIAEFDRWNQLDESAYQVAKARWYDRAVESAVRFVPDFRRQVIATDMFTPTTIRRFTWHDNGAVYGAPDKKLDGTTHLNNVFLCGTDQGFVGIIGSIMSGISIANQHCLRD